MSGERLSWADSWFFFSCAKKPNNIFPITEDCKHELSSEFPVMTMWSTVQIRCGEVEEAGRVERDAKCLARRWVSSSCCEWRCSPGWGGKVRPSFGSLEGGKSRLSEAKTSSLQARQAPATHTCTSQTHNIFSLLYGDILAKPSHIFTEMSAVCCSWMARLCNQPVNIS